ncbi:RHS repeat-associated core domain containing protein-containing protein [Burkholderia sp. BT03]|nr:RHS repeat-associated core domain containing protein-containing protein [Burkholderia sp. BT03]SKC65256.1 RHS repeat-associated core domain-containing protein [Paraburkholderia hospita]
MASQVPASTVTAAAPVPAVLHSNAEQRRLLISQVPAAAVAAQPELKRVAVESVKDHAQQIFIQCLYMVPLVGNAMSLADVGTDLYRLFRNEPDPASGKKYAENVLHWGVLAIDAIGVIPGAGNASRPARAVVKDVLLAFASGGLGVAVDMLWAAAGGDAQDFMLTLDKHLESWKNEIINGLRTISRSFARFIEDPTSVEDQMEGIGKNDGFFSWVPSQEHIALVALDQLLSHTGLKSKVLAWLAEFDRNTPAMIGQAIGTVGEAGSLACMAWQIAQAIGHRGKLSEPQPSLPHGEGAHPPAGHKGGANPEPHQPAPSHEAQVSTGARTEPDQKPGSHEQRTQQGAEASRTPAKNGCGCPPVKGGGSINYAMGDENLEQTDFALDGVVPIVWTRLYRSSLVAYDGSALGARWSSPYHLSLTGQEDVLTYFDADGRAVELPRVAIGEALDVPREQMTVSRPDARRVQLRFLDGSREDYELHATPSARRYVLTARTGRDGLGVTLAYNAAGELAGLSDGHGLAVALDYTDGRVTAIRRLDAAGGTLDLLARYEYSREGDLVAHTDVLGHRRTYAYEQHLLTRYTDFNGFATCLEWDWPARRAGAPAPADAKCVHEWRCNDRYPDERYAELFFEYHREHWYTKVTDADGHATIHRYDYYNQIVRVEQPDGSRDTYTWDDRGQLIAMQNGAGQTERFAYDEAGRIAAVTDALGNTTRTEYDAAGLPVQVTNAAGDVTHTAYDALGRPASVTNAAGATSYRWSDSGRLIALTDPKGGTREFAYDSAGRLVSARDCSGYETRYQYDARGYLLARTDALGQVTSYRHDARGQLLQVTRPDGIGEQLAYDAEGNLTTYTDGAGQVTRYSYNGNHQPYSRTDAAGRMLAYSYDRQWRLTQLRNENGETMRFRYDALGRLVDETGFDDSVTQYGYDAAGRLAQSRQGDAWTVYTRDALGRLTQRDMRGPNGAVSERFFHDLRGRLTTAQTEDSTVRLHYDDAGHLVAEEQHVSLALGESYVTVSRHEYDALGNRIRTTLPNTRTVDWLRYGSGHVHGVLLDGQPLLDFERDRLHRETGRVHAGFSQQREYDPAGRLTRFSVMAAHPSTQHERLAERRLRYDAAGQLARIDDRTRGASEYGYDPVGRLLKAVTPELTEIFAFDPAGNPVDPAKIPPYPDGLETEHERTARYAREAAEDAEWMRAHPGQKPFSRHDARGVQDREKVEAWRKSLPKWLDNVMGEYLGVTYEYDAHGNLARRREPSGLTWLYEWDAAGRLKEARRYARPPTAHEVDHQVRTADSVRFVPGKVQPEVSVRLRYDAFGRRTLKEVERAGGGIDRTVFTWDGDLMLLEERFHEAPAGRRDEGLRTYGGVRLVREDPDDAYALPVAQRQHTLGAGRYQWQAASVYLYEPGTFVPLARLDETLEQAAHLATGTDGRFVGYPARTRHATYFYQNDHLGTPQELVDESGKVVWLGRYRAWGALRGAKLANGEAAETGNLMRAQGQYHDEELGLHYNRMRYYDPHSGRFISKDPIGLAGGINVYQYAPNPVQWIDPLGLQKTAGGACPLCNTQKCPVHSVIEETLNGKGNITSQHVLTSDQLLDAGTEFLGAGYTEIGKSGSGVYRSTDGTRQFRIDNNSIQGNHAPNVPHGHLETYAPGAAKPTANNHIPFCG